MGNKFIRSIVVAAMVGFVPTVFATIGNVESTVLKVLNTSNGTFGNCMIKMNKSMASGGLNCPDNGWVSFSCTGDFVPKDEAAKLFDSAQMAFALGTRIEVFIDDTKKHNGFCTAFRVDVIK